MKNIFKLKTLKNFKLQNEPMFIMENWKMPKEQKEKNPQSHYPKELFINLSVYIFQIYLYTF